MKPLNLVILLFSLGFLLAVVQVGALTIAFDKLGLSPQSAVLLLLASVGGSLINLPLFQLRADPPRPEEMPPMGRFFQFPALEWAGKTVVAVNVGGGLVPLLFSLYLMRQYPLPLGKVLLAIGLMSLLCYTVSRPIPRLGIGMPILVAPVSAALLAIILDPTFSAPLAYICGTLGVLIGADLLRLGDIRKIGAPVASIGGAGTFDGIFLTGLVAVLLA